MPIIRHGGVVCHFAHVPKCGGTSIERYCDSVGLSVAFLDNEYISHPAPQRWNNSSPQHIDGYSLSRLFPVGFFDFGFAVVRDPVDRVVSAFKWQKATGAIPPDACIDEFIENSLEVSSNTLGEFDNHFFPQTKFLIPGLNYFVFHMKNGLGDVKSFLDEWFFGYDPGPTIGHHNNSVDRSGDSPLPNDTSVDLIHKVYCDDYARFWGQGGR